MTLRYKNIDLLLEMHRLKKDAIKQRLAEFKALPPEHYFYELVYCFMTPQSSAVNSLKAQQTLASRDFERREIDPEPLLHGKDYYIRFHKTKARLLVEMKRTYSEILRHVTDTSTALEKRAWLAENVKGLGYKESTHFLRNIGRNDGLAILDRHILKNLRRHGVVRSIPRSLTKKMYLRTEMKFQEFAKAVGVPLDELDLVFWSNEAGEILK